MYDRDTTLALKAPRYRVIEDGEPGDWLDDFSTYDPLLDASLLGDVKTPEGKVRIVHEKFPYNEVRVIGQSPIDKTREGYSGTDAQGVIITPEAGFGSTIDEPFGKLRTLYDVTSVPEPAIVSGATAYGLPTEIRATRPGPSPEDVFAVEAPGVAPEEGQIRGRTPLNGDSPLGDAPKVKTSTSPLD